MLKLDYSLVLELREERFFVKTSYAIIEYLDCQCATFLGYLRSLFFYYFDNTKQKEELEQTNENVIYTLPTLQEDGSFYCSAKQIESKLGMGRSVQDACKKRLMDANLIEIQRRRLRTGEVVNHFLLNFEKYNEILKAYESKKKSNVLNFKKVDKVNTDADISDLSKNSNSDLHKIDNSEMSKISNSDLSKIDTKKESNITKNLNIKNQENKNLKNTSSSSFSSEKNFDKNFQSLFEIWQNAKLPNYDDEESFKKQFNFAMQSLHEKDLTFDDLFDAVKNYASVINQPDCWMKTRFALIPFLKKISDFSSDVFSAKTYLRQSESVKEAVINEENEKKKREEYEKTHWCCPKCKTWNARDESLGRDASLCRCGYDIKLNRVLSSSEISKRNAEYERKMSEIMANVKAKFGMTG